MGQSRGLSVPGAGIGPLDHLTTGSRSRGRGGGVLRLPVAGKGCGAGPWPGKKDGGARGLPAGAGGPGGSPAGGGARLPGRAVARAGPRGLTAQRRAEQGGASVLGPLRPGLGCRAPGVRPSSVRRSWVSSRMGLSHSPRAASAPPGRKERQGATRKRKGPGRGSSWRRGDCLPLGRARGLPGT
ncbi:hypothetical protein VULLAG_LOCUS19898 [Vulpes lagopus]